MNFYPHNYQDYAIRYIETHPVAAVLLDMGLGKTIISLTAVYDLLFDSFEVHRVLVVAPLRVARDTWPAEIQKWEHLRGLTYAVAVGTPKERKAALMQGADITIINRENLQWLIEESGFSFDFDMVIIDELSSFKNHKSKQNPGEENAFRQLRLNQWVKQSVRWMPMDKWDACAFSVSEDDLEGRICYGGLDLSSTTDITAFVLVFPPLDEEDKYYVLPYFWIPEETLDLRVRRDHVPYDLWERQGVLMTTEGNVVHYSYIEKFIEQLGERFNIREIAFDRWGAVQMVQNLEGMGFTVVPFGQGFKDMSPPTKELMKLVLEGKLAHGGHPVLRWMMDNIFIRSDPAGNIKADKEKSTEKIDGAIATIMGLDRAIRCGNDSGASVYDSRGLLFI